MSELSSGINKASKWGVVWGVLAIVLGFVAIGSPYVSGKAVTLMIGAALLLAGVSMTIFAFQAPSFGRGVLQLLFGGLTVLVGIAVLAQPGIALIKLTMLLGIYFIFDGVSTLIVAWNVKPHRGWGWLTFNGAVTIALAWMVLSGWPESSLFVVGILVGIRLIFAGMAMIALGTAGRQVVKAIEDGPGPH